MKALLALVIGIDIQKNKNDMLLIEFFISEYSFGQGLPNILTAKRELPTTTNDRRCSLGRPQAPQYHHPPSAMRQIISMGGQYISILSKPLLINDMHAGSGFTKNSLTFTLVNPQSYFFNKNLHYQPMKLSFNLH